MNKKGDAADMRIAIPVWHEQICTVFDFARRLLVVDVDDGIERGSSEVPFEEESITVRARALARLRIDVLICGAISSDLAKMVAGYGIEIVPFIKGLAKEALAAFLTGEIEDPRFLLSGSVPEARQQETFKARPRAAGADRP